MKILAAAIAALVLTAPIMAADAKVTGTWAVAVEGPHGAAAMSLVLKQDGAKVTGTFVSGHGPDLALAGDFTDNTLKLESEGGDEKVIFNAKLKTDGTLAGYVSGPMGDMKWTAERMKDKK